MGEKQALNGAYYGPSIPPPTNHYHRPGRGSGCGGGCCCCLFGLIFKIIFAIVFILGLAALIFWLIFRPVNIVKFHVTNASLTEFNLDSNNNLNYRLALNITVRNPNSKIGIHYDRIEARAQYEDQRLHSVFLDPFYQGHKTTSVLDPVFEGQQLLVGNDVSEFNQDSAAGGLYKIGVKLSLRVRFKLGRINSPRFRPRVKCELNVPLSSSNGGSVGRFEPTRCEIDIF